MNTGLYVSEISESLDASRGTLRKQGKPQQQANDCFSKKSVVVQTRTEELEPSITVVIDKLKSPLSAIITTSNAIFSITDLTPEELYEYLQQIRSTAYRMDEIIDRLKLQPEVRKTDGP